jgi:putative endopeptidase
LRETLKDANVYCPDMDYIKHVESLYTASNLGVLKDFAIFNVTNTIGGFVGDDITELNKEIQTIRLGAPIEVMDIETRALMTVTSIMSASMSKLYADKYVTADVRSDVTQMVELVRAKYRERINALDWMGGETKKKAIEKLDAIKTYVAYPDTYGTRYTFDVKAKADGGNLIDFFLDKSKVDFMHGLELIKKPYELTLWDKVPTYTVNAFYSPTENAIIVPAGILQEPLYTKGGRRELNLGAIGAVIAHEFSHAFDNSGAQYDKNGTIANWWADADYAAFTEMTGKVVAALSDIVFVGDQRVNGILCAGETIADLGAMSCILDIADDAEGADMALVMRSWSYIWAARMSAEVAALLISGDVHPPNKVRVNFVLPHNDAFYDVFGVGKDDGMYIAPEDRIAIW